MVTSKISTTEGSGKNIATISITEDAITKELQRVIPVDITGATVAPLTDTQLRATPVPVSGSVTTGGLTDTQLRATAVPVSGPLTDTQLRATAVPVSGTVTASGPVTDTQLRATPVPVSGTVAVTNAGITSIDGKTPVLGQALAAASVPVVLTAAQISTLTPPAAITNFANETGGNLAAINTLLGAKTDAKSTATDATSVSAMQVLKQISASVQAPPSQAVTFTGSTDVATQTTLAAAKTDLDTIAGAVSSSKVNVNISSGNPTTMPVTNTGTFAVQNTSAAGNGKTKKWVTGSASSNGSNTIIAAVGGKKITICGYSLITASTTAVTATFKDGTGGTAMWTVPLQAITGTVCGANLATQAPDYFFQGSTNTLVDLYLSSANAVTYSVSYWEE